MMKDGRLFAAPLGVALAVMCAAAPAFAQGTAIVPYGGGNAKPVAQEPAADPRDTPEEIAKDSARDLKGGRFYNRPGATRADYDRDWQTCRLIARGSRTPSGMVVYSYNPAIVSPMAAGAGGALGGLIAGAIIEGQQRRANRQACLLIKGWRMVEVPAAEAARVDAMLDADRSAYFDTIVGAATVNGKITERTSFALAPDPMIRLDAPLAGPASLFLGRKVDVAAPLSLGADEGAIVFAYRRPDAPKARSATVDFYRYDPAARDLVYQPKDWKKKGDKTTYYLSAMSSDKKAAYEVQVLKMTAGDYVLSGTSINAMPVTVNNCFGAPTFHLEAGEVLYVGDFVPLWGKTSSGQFVATVGWTRHIDDARAALLPRQPALADRMKPAPLHNRATYACAAVQMERWDLPGVDALPDPPAPSPAPAAPVAPDPTAPVATR